MTELITIDNPNKLPRGELYMCETKEQAELIHNVNNVIYALYHTALDYTTYFVTQEKAE